MLNFPGSVTITPTGVAYVTLFFDNIQMTGLDQVFYVGLNQTDPGSGVNVQTTPSTIALQPVGKSCVNCYWLWYVCT